MKIEKLNIYGFGKHENVMVDFGPGITVFYGLNEAGKTTIQQFILHILFGFPPKNNALLRYEPKSGGKYGGQVHLEMKHMGNALLNVSAGNQLVMLLSISKMERRAETRIEMLLRQYDRASFESIFSFSFYSCRDLKKWMKTN